jgi:hypothetical protein
MISYMIGFDCRYVILQKSLPVSLNERETRLTGSNPPWTKAGRLEFADQVAKSRWLHIRSVNHVFALTLTVNDAQVLAKEASLKIRKNPKVQSTRFEAERGLRSAGRNLQINATLLVHRFRFLYIDSAEWNRMRSPSPRTTLLSVSVSILRVCHRTE